MYPLLYDEDIIALKWTAFNKIEINDIVTFKKNNKYITHRVIYRKKSFLITRGDNNISADGKIKAQQLIGRVTEIIRNGQSISIEDIYLMQSTLYYQEIVKIKKYFEKENISFVILKGLPLYYYLEKEHPKRYYGDCDILIKRNQLKQVEKVFIKYGYKRERENIHQNIPLSSIQKKNSEISYFKIFRNFPIVFDIHLEPSFLSYHRGKFNKLYPQKDVERLTNDFLENKMYVTVQAEKFPILSRENLILYLALHFFHHNFKEMYRLQLLEKAFSFSTNRLDSREVVTKLIKKIKEYRVSNFVYPSFLLLNYFYENKNVKDLLKSITPDKRKLQYIRKQVPYGNAFEGDNEKVFRMILFKNIYFLSPNKVYKKILIFLQPDIFASLLKYMVIVSKAYFKYFTQLLKK